MQGYSGLGEISRLTMPERIASPQRPAKRWISPLEVSAAVLLGDLVLLAFGCALVHFQIQGLRGPLTMSGVLFGTFVPLITVAALGAYGLYAPTLLVKGGVSLGLLCSALLLSAGLVSLLAHIVAAAAPRYAPDTVWLMAVLGLSAVLIVGGRTLLARVISSTAPQAVSRARVVLVGGSVSAQAELNLARLLTGEPIRLVGYLDPANPDSGPGVPQIEAVERLLSLIQRSEVDQVVISANPDRTAELEPLIARLRNTPVEIAVLFDSGLLGTRQARPSERQVLWLPLRERPIAGPHQAIKKVEDLLLGTAMLLVFGPLMATIALAIKLDSPGPVLFRQDRYGFRNRIISVLKFRTMYDDAADPGCEQQTRTGDQRVTRVGRLLRQFSLDELPQIINVLRGEMSVIGPRPHAAATKAAGQRFEEAVEHYMARHQVKPGMSGWAQVNGYRGETDTLEKLQRRLQYDLDYINNWSLWMDMQILLRTAGCVLGAENAV